MRTTISIMYAAHLPAFGSSNVPLAALDLVAEGICSMTLLFVQIRALESRVAGLVCEVGDAQRCARAHALAARQAEIGARSLHDALARATQVAASPLGAELVDTTEYVIIGVSPSALRDELDIGGACFPLSVAWVLLEHFAAHLAFLELACGFQNIAGRGRQY